MSPVVAITGATAGVGRATARAFAQKGYDVGLVSRGEEALEAGRKECEAAGVRAVAVPTDVAEWDAVDGAAKRIEDELGPIDVWVNDAMATVFSPFLHVDPDEFDRATRVTYLGYVNGTRAALNRMTERDRGTVVQVGSALAYRGIPLQSAYCGAKHAIQGFTESVRCELLHDRSNVHICMVQMPALNTPQFDIQRNKMKRKAQPVPPIYEPEVAAKAIVYAAEHRRREIWVGGTTVATILANRVMPYLLDHYLGLSGYDSQLRDEPADHDRPDSLFEPVPGDRGAHGSFESKSTPRSWVLDVDLSAPVAFAKETVGTAAAKAGAKVLQKLLG
ncbi:MAG TPA: SDR family oxidoreductase [Acidimicrobiales bacterium]|nr:SDR family oxidoreductase [Acidimicrobiales bacterium]